MAELRYSDLGRTSFDEALATQQSLAAQVTEGTCGPRVLLVEHDPAVITLGRSAKAEHLLASPETLAEAGICVRHISRGGDITWHGPGQLVAYPILRLDARSLGLRQYVRSLEEAVIAVLARMGVTAGRIEGLTGVWVGRKKISAIGVAVKRWVTYHGLSLNVGPDLLGFSLIVPCGIQDHGVTSISAQLGRTVTLEEVKPLLVEELAHVLGMESVAAPEIGGPLRDGAQTARPTSGRPVRLPSWLRKPLPRAGRREEVLGVLDDLKLTTVCRGAKCPNQAECHANGTATFMILGDRCSRSCGFCAVGHGCPPPPLRPDEPEAVAQAASMLGLRHVVITSVTRDDLPDGGAEAFARTIRAVRRQLPQAGIEVLTSDFQGRRESVETVLDAGPDVFNHNIETVPRLYAKVRPQAQYARSLEVLAQAAQSGRDNIATKSGLMVGLGETDDEIIAVLKDLAGVGCQRVTIGQYLSPSPAHLPVARFVEPRQFEQWRRQGIAMGFQAVMAGPFVRSSYHAGEMMDGG